MLLCISWASSFTKGGGSLGIGPYFCSFLASPEDRPRLLPITAHTSSEMHAWPGNEPLFSNRETCLQEGFGWLAWSDAVPRSILLFSPLRIFASMDGWSAVLRTRQVHEQYSGGTYTSVRSEANRCLLPVKCKKKFCTSTWLSSSSSSKSSSLLESSE